MLKIEEIKKMLYYKAISLNPNYEDIIRKEPQHANAYYEKGISLFKLGKYQDALSSFDKAIKIDLNNSNALCGKGSTMEHMNLYKEAIEYYGSC